MREIEEVDGAPAVVKPVDDALDFLEIRERTLVLAVTRLDRRQRHQDAELEVRRDAQAGPDAVQDRAQQGARLGEVVLLELAVREPIGRQRSIDGTVCRLEQADRVGSVRDGVRTAVEPGCGFRASTEDFGPARRVLRDLEKRGVCVVCLDPATDREMQVRLETAPCRRLVADQPAGGNPKTFGEERERRHRRPDQAVLERADVRLGVALAGKLLLGEARAEPGLLQAATDPLGEAGVIGGGWSSKARGRFHPAQCTRATSHH